MAREPLLFLQDLTIRYGPALAVDALCLEVQRGEIFGLLGPNGSGKSSTLAAISGDLEPSAGIVRVAGLYIHRDQMTYRRHLGVVPQELAIYEEMTGEENLHFFGQLYGLSGRPLRQRIAEVLDMVRLGDMARRLVKTWSGGMQRRLNLACAILHKPDLLLLDEPTVGLDLQSRDAVVDVMRTLRSHGCGILWTTHHLEEVEIVCDRIGIMNTGRIVVAGTLAELAALVEPDEGEAWPTFGAGAEGVALQREAPTLELLFRQLTSRSRT